MSAEFGSCGPMARALAVAVCFAAAERLLYFDLATVASRRCSCCRTRMADFSSSAVFADLKQGRWINKINVFEFFCSLVT